MVLGRLAEPVVAFAFLGDSMSSLDMRFFIEVKLLFEYLLHFGFGFGPGFRFFLSNAVYWNIFPSTLILLPA